MADRSAPPRTVKANELDPVAEAIRQWRRSDFGSQTYMETIASVRRLGQYLTDRMEQELRRFEITFSQYEAITLLLFASDHALPLGKMGRRLTVHPTTITNTIDQLEKKELVVRERAPRDRRQVIARLTPAGRERAEEASRSLASIKFGLSEMKRADAQTLTHIVREFRAAVHDYN